MIVTKIFAYKTWSECSLQRTQM